MFSFIKWLQGSFQKLKRNKGLWFTTITVLSSAGIITAMVVISTMSTSVAKQTYKEEKRLNLIQLNGYFHTQYEDLEKTASFLAFDPRIIANIKRRRFTIAYKLLGTIQKHINAHEDEYLTKLEIYPKNLKKKKGFNSTLSEVITDTKETIEGIVVNPDGVFMMVMVPIMDKNNTIGALEVRRSIHAVIQTAEVVEKEFAFILDKNMLSTINLQHKSGKYRDINEQYSILYKHYTTNFLPHIEKLDMKQLRQDKFYRDSNFFTNYQELTDVSGKPIGLAFIGESVANANSFVHIAQNMISSVTTVALGLVISLILFMF